MDIKQIFKSIDEDGSGSIDASELMRALILAGKRPTREQVEKLLAKHDADGNGTLEFHEFEEMIQNWDAEDNSTVGSENSGGRGGGTAALEADEPTGPPATASEEDIEMLKRMFASSDETRAD